MKTARLLGLGLATTGLVACAADMMSVPPVGTETWRTYSGPSLPDGLRVQFEYPAALMPTADATDGKSVWPGRRSLTVLCRERRSLDYRLLRPIVRRADEPEWGETVSIRKLPWDGKYPDGRSSCPYIRQCGLEPYRGWVTRINDPKRDFCCEVRHIWHESEAPRARVHLQRISQSFRLVAAE